MSQFPSPKPDWFAIDVDLEPDAREAVEYALMEAGALGTETSDAPDQMVRSVGYFKHQPDRERVRTELLDALRIYNLPSSSVREMTLRTVADRDWLDEWRKGWQPVEAGSFIIAPPWSELDQRHNKKVIRIEPGMAFGTGTHETTRLCLAAIERYFSGGSFLDVGTGTGILAIAAAVLFPEAVVTACDTDPEAIQIARANAVANQVGNRITFSVGSINEITSSADLVCANLTADVIIPLLPSLIGVTCGRLVLSGILETQFDAVFARLSECGVSEVEITQDGEWIAIAT